MTRHHDSAGCALLTALLTSVLATACWDSRPVEEVPATFAEAVIPDDFLWQTVRGTRLSLTIDPALLDPQTGGVLEIRRVDRDLLLFQGRIGGGVAPQGALPLGVHVDELLVRLRSRGVTHEAHVRRDAEGAFTHTFRAGEEVSP